MMSSFERLSEKDQRALKSGGVLTLVILVGVVFVWPLVDDWDRVNAEIKKKRDQFTATKTQISDRLESQDMLTKMRKDAVLFPTMASLNEHPAILQQQVESLDGFDTLLIRRLEGAPPRGEGQVYRSTLSVQFSGRLQDLDRFLRSAERAEPKIRVDRLSVATDQVTPGRVNGNFLLVGSAVVMEKVGKS